MWCQTFGKTISNTGSILHIEQNFEINMERAGNRRSSLDTADITKTGVI